MSTAKIDLLVTGGTQGAAEVNKVTGAFAGMEKAARSVSGSAVAASQQQSAAVQQTAQATSQAFAAQGAQVVTLTQGYSGMSNAVKETVTQKTKLAGATVATGEAVEKMTTRISVGRGVLSGYDQILEGVARSIGGIPLPMAIVIGLTSAMLPKIIDLITAKKEQIAIDLEQVRTNLALAQSQSEVTAIVNGHSFTMQSQNRVYADVVTALRNVMSEQEAYARNTAGLNDSFKKLQDGVTITRKATDEYGRVIGSVSETTSTFIGGIEGGNIALAEQEKKMQPALASLRALRAAYGADTDALIGYAENMHLANSQTESGRNALEFLRQQLDKDTESFKALADAIGKMTLKMEDSSVSAARLKLELSQIKAPVFDIRGTEESIQAARNAVMGNLFAQNPAGQHGARDFGIASGDAKRLNDELMAYATRHAPNAAKALQVYREEFSKLSPVERQSIEHMKQQGANMSAFADKTKQADAAAKALAQTTAQLNREAQLSTIGNTFDDQIKKTRLEFQFRREELARNKQLTEQNLASLAKIEESTIRHISDEKLKAAKAAIDANTRLSIENIQEESVRRQVQIDFETDRYEEALKERFGKTAFVEQQVMTFKQAKLVEYFNWESEQYAKHSEKIADLIGRTIKAKQEAIGKGIADLINDTIRAGEREHRRFERLGGQFDIHPMRLDAFVGDQNVIEQLKRVDGMMKGLGVTVQNVDAIFGSSSRTLDQFEQRLATVAATGTSGFNSMRAVAKDFLQDLIKTGELWRILGNTIAGVFQSAISGQDSWKDALIKGFLTAIAQIAMMLGNLFLLAAAGLAFIPGLNWSAGPLIAAGIALMAFAGVLQGVAGLIGKDRASSASAATSGGASSPAAQTQRPAIGPNVIPFSTSGRNGGSAIVVHVAMDREGANDFLSGRGVVTTASARGAHNQVLKKALS